jgi:hypothetical protein
MKAAATVAAVGGGDSPLNFSQGSDKRRSDEYPTTRIMSQAAPIQGKCPGGAR